jgi:Fatty acid desaturase
MCRKATLIEKKESSVSLAPTDTDSVSSTESVSAAALAPDEAWLRDLDLAGFANEIRALGKRLEAQQGQDDVRHLNKMCNWSNGWAALGLLTMGLFGKVNPLAIVGLSLYTFSRWTMIAHHTCHGGYDKVSKNAALSGANSRFTRFTFGVGSLWRRFYDWFDYMMPEAWNVEHNNRHHYNLSEGTDPDLVERNLQDLRHLRMPMVLKYVYVFVVMCIWKWFYYSPNTYKELKLAQWRRQGKALPSNVDPEDSITIKSILMGDNPFYSFAEFFGLVLGPYILIHFFITPLPYLALGQYLSSQDWYTANTYGIPTFTGTEMYWNAVANLLLADILTNIHGFTAVVTNHAGSDMYRFRYPCRPYSGSFYLRQVLASVDYSMGTDAVDFMHGWLNYQIEHHMFPALSMLSYQKSAPEVQAICAKYGVPYIKEHVLIRLKKTADIMVGSTSMRWFPEEYENLFLEQDAAAEAAKTK